MKNESISNVQNGLGKRVIKSPDESLGDFLVRKIRKLEFRLVETRGRDESSCGLTSR
ncbi:hypothetical protein HAX54_019952, partial [Datura stramonium]|nr:hypothetical protein [Datura stramonium]